MHSCLHATLFFIIVHRFSTGLRSELFLSHSSREILFFFKNSLATFNQCHGALFCMNIVQPWMCRCSFSFSLSNSIYLGPFIVVLGGMNYRPAVPWHDMTLQFIWLSRCSIVAATYFLSKHLPNSCLSGDVQSAAWCISQKTTLSSTQGETSLFFFITGVWCGFCAGLWDSSP